MPRQQLCHDWGTSINGELAFLPGSSVVNFPAIGLTNASFSSKAALARTQLEQTPNAVYAVPLTAMRDYSDLAALPPATATGIANMGLKTETFGANAANLSTDDASMLGSTTFQSRFLFTMPAEYDDGETVTVRLKSGMETTVADTSATVDVEAYLFDETGGLDGSPTDLCTTAAQSINSLTAATQNFTLTPTNLVSGSVLDIRLTATIDDSVTGTAVIGNIYSVAVLCDIRG